MWSKIIKKYKIVKHEGSFLLKVKTSHGWKFLSWYGVEGHCNGEYCLFNTRQSAIEFGEYWISNDRVKQYYRGENG